MRAAGFLAIACAALLVTAAGACADDVRPATLDVRETEPGRYEVRWQTPMRGRARLRIVPRLPAGATVVAGTYDRKTAGDSSIERFAFLLEGGFVGREIGVDGIAISSRNVILRLRLRDGRDLRAVLGATRTTYLVEPPPSTVRTPWTEDIARAAAAGFRHGTRHFAHVLLAVALVLAGVSGRWVLALGAFLGGAILGGCFGPVAILSPDGADALVALVAVLAAREALLGRSRRLLLLAALAGLAHGLAGTVGGADASFVVASALGLDLAHLAVGGLAGLGLSLLSAPQWRPATAWVVGVVGVALALAAVTRSPAFEAPAAEAATLPQSLVVEASPGAAPPATGLVTDVEAYLDVGVFETRLEILGRWPVLAAWLETAVPAADGATIPVALQEPLLARVASALGERCTVTLDTAEPAPLPTTVRTGFATQDATGTYLRDEPVDEAVAEALVGVALSYRTPAIPSSVEVVFASLPPGLEEVRARVIDPEISLEVTLLRSDPRLRWTNELEQDPYPSLTAIRVERPTVPVPLLSIALLGVAVVAGLVLLRRGRGVVAGAALRLGLAIALLLAPLLTLDAGAWIARVPTPTPRGARAITSALLENLYRAFNVRDEEDVYEHLALSLTEASRTDAYLEVQKALVVARVGGARTHIDVVELVGLENLTPTSSGAFAADARWTVGGSVTHFGHRHLRQNLYSARVVIAPVEGAWKIDTFDVHGIERQR